MKYCVTLKGDKTKYIEADHIDVTVKDCYVFQAGDYEHIEIVAVIPKSLVLHIEKDTSESA